MLTYQELTVSTHSHPKVAARHFSPAKIRLFVSTHSHPKVAATIVSKEHAEQIGFNTQPPEGGCTHKQGAQYWSALFQHTATRRWLLQAKDQDGRLLDVSTHSHPKVAAVLFAPAVGYRYSFNTQPPEGGCIHRSRC